MCVNGRKILHDKAKLMKNNRKIVQQHSANNLQNNACIFLGQDRQKYQENRQLLMAMIKST